jgi:hypothetical protein
MVETTFLDTPTIHFPGYSMTNLQLLYDWSIKCYKLQSYDSGVASIFHMPTKDALEDNLSASANQVSTEDNL